MILRLLFAGLLIWFVARLADGSKQNQCANGICIDEQDDIMSALQVGRMKKTEKLAELDSESLDDEGNKLASEAEIEDFLKELYTDESELPTDEDWWIPLERAPAYIQEFHSKALPIKGAKQTEEQTIVINDEVDDTTQPTAFSKMVFSSQDDKDPKQMLFGTSYKSRKNGGCIVNEEGVNLFWATCADAANAMCGKGCYLYTGPCKHTAAHQETTYYSDLVMPSKPVIGVEEVTKKTASTLDHLWVDAGNHMSPAIPDRPFVENLSNKKGWGHILNPYTARTSHQMHIAVRKLSGNGNRLVDHVLKNKFEAVGCEFEKWVECNHDLHCNYCQAAMFKTEPAGFTEAYKRATSCGGCLGEMLKNPEGETTLGTVGISLLYLDGCNKNAKPPPNHDKNHDKRKHHHHHHHKHSLAETNETDFDEEENEASETDEASETSNPGGRFNAASNTANPLTVLGRKSPKSITQDHAVGSNGNLKRILLLTSSGKGPCSIKYAIS